MQIIGISKTFICISSIGKKYKLMRGKDFHQVIIPLENRKSEADEILNDEIISLPTATLYSRFSRTYHKNNLYTIRLFNVSSYNIVHGYSQNMPYVSDQMYPYSNLH